MADVNIVPEAFWGPGRCIASGSTAGPFVDAGMRANRNDHVYLSVPYLLSLAPALGLVPAPELQQALTDLEQAVAAVEAQARRIEAFEEDIQNVAQAMANFTAEVLVAE